MLCLLRRSKTVGVSEADSMSTLGMPAGVSLVCAKCVLSSHLILTSLSRKEKSHCTCVRLTDCRNTPTFTLFNRCSFNCNTAH